MYAVVVTGGKQYRVMQGERLRVELLDLEAGSDGALSPSQPRQITQGMALDADSGVAWGR